MAIGYTQIFSFNYFEYFSLVTKITLVRLFLSTTAVRHWPLHQLDIKMLFIHVDLDDEAYMDYGANIELFKGI